ncbi:MAG: peptidyl-prolyl cis-trans isomerase [Bdellovibrionales bacterium]
MLRTLLFAFLSLLSACEFSKPPLGNKTILDVNGKQMTARNFAQELAYRLKDHDALSAKDPQIVTVMKAKIVEEFVVQVLSESWAKDNGVIIKAEELQEQIRAIQKSYPDSLSFRQALAEQGTTFKAWKDRLYNTLLQKRVAQKVVEKVEGPTETEISEYYNSHREEFAVQESAQVRQIVVATESDAKTIEQQLKMGKRLAALAKEYSISPEGTLGGDVGWVEKGLSDIFESAFRMKTGQRSPIIKSAFGYHIFEVTGRKPARVKPYKEVHAEIKAILMEKKEQSLYLAWLEEQVRKARVFKDQAFIDALKVETKAL